ncbi:biosynthetic-type acetolactate synthase large subunit [Streptococcaceae bacterium ESL0729]|nr:biosynthetic-type acetolactate synthase large subunit [Streptococcaceae bacterium ESL0729]
MEKIKLQEKQSGSELLLDSLKSLGVDTIFGYPGGAVLPFYDALYDFKGIRHILSRHEQGAIHEAEGYAKSSDKAGVVIVTSGPGATNVVTGLADAYMDSVPLLVFTGQVASPGIGKDAFQEVDLIDITIPITKYNYQIRDTKDIPRIVREAYHLATTGRKGPVVIDLPKDVSAKMVAEIYDPALKLPNYEPTAYPDLAELKKIIYSLSQAKKPVVLVGGGVNYAEAKDEFIDFIEKHNLPVVTTLLGQGIMDVSHPLFLGMGGMHGSYAANTALMETDFLINIGSRFDDRVVSNPKDFAPAAKIAHIDIDNVEIDKIIKADIKVISDAKLALIELLKFDASDILVHRDWLDETKNNKFRAPYSYDLNDDFISPQELVKIIGDYTQGDAIIVTDVGQHQMWAAQHYPYKNSKQLITSGGLGTMGFGIPAAIGAKLANPDKEVILFVGDGGFQMTNQELALLNQYGIGIKIILINNTSLGMVRQWQTSFHNNHLSQSVLGFSDPDFQILAEAYGIEHYRLTNPRTLGEDLKVIEKNNPLLVEVMINPEEQVLPMVPAGQANNKMIGVVFND